MKSNEECVKLCTEAFKKGWKAKVEDLREQLEGENPLSKPPTYTGKTLKEFRKEMIEYGKCVRNKELLAELEKPIKKPKSYYGYFGKKG